MMLTNPETRRALRSVVQAIVVFALLWLCWRWTDKLDPDGLREATRWALAIIALGTFFYGLENTTRAFKLKVGRDGAEVEAGGE